MRHDGTSLVLVSANPVGGWSFAIEQQSGRELEVDFQSPGGRVKFNAELEDGQVRVRVDSEVSQSDSSGSGSGSSSSGSSGSGSSGSGSSGSGSSGSGSSGSDSSGSGSSGSGGDDGEGHD